MLKLCQFKQITDYPLIFDSKLEALFPSEIEKLLQNQAVKVL